MATSLRRGLESTAVSPTTARVAEMKPTPRSPRLGMFADALMAVRDFANRAQIPQGVPLIGGEGIGSLVLGRAPEELVEMSYGNMPVRINPYAGRTASFMPEIKPGRQAQVADLLSLAGVPGGGRTAAAAMMGAMPDAGGLERAMIAYHGTPHRFERFDASKIGTGEGAQAYGHGIYFAESPDVAKGYRASISAVPGMQFGLPDGPIKGIATLIAARGDVGERMARQAYEKSVPDIDAAINQAKKAISESSSLYTVDIPDEMIPRILDWDKPLSQQPSHIKDALLYDMNVKGQWQTGPSGERRFIQPPDANMSGGAAYARLSRLLGGDKAASDALSTAGIKGIRYLDANSRGPGQGTSNFVVFPGEEQRVQILKRE